MRKEFNDPNVIDFHVHVGKREDWHPWVLDFLGKENPTLFDDFDVIMSPTGLEDFLISQGIRKAVILAEYSPLTTGVVTNEFVHAFCQAGTRDMFVPFASVDPTSDPDPVSTLDRCVSELGFRGLKLYPSYQHFYPNDPAVYPLYEIAHEFDIPVMFHTGTSVYRNSKTKFADPIHLDEVAADFPELKIVMAHSGRGFWYDRAFFLSRIHKNLFMEIAGLPPKKLLDYFPDLEKNADKVIFGSDWPGLEDIGRNVEDIRSIGLKMENVERILWMNAEKVLGL
jgi:predicted TIM-barrel fold metal-dependent hydrolase